MVHCNANVAPYSTPPTLSRRALQKRNSTMIKPHKWRSESSSDTKVMSGKHSTKCEKRVYLQIKKERKRKQK